MMNYTIFKYNEGTNMNDKEIEKKWQDIWEKEKRFEVPNHVDGKKNA